MRVIFSAASRRDMLNVLDYIAADNPHRAGSFLTELQQACLSLHDRPLRFPQLDGFAPHYRRRVHGNYLIIYKVADDTVTIMRVVSSWNDINQLVLGD